MDFTEEPSQKHLACTSVPACLRCFLISPTPSDAAAAVSSMYAHWLRVIALSSYCAAGGSRMLVAGLTVQQHGPARALPAEGIKACGTVPQKPEALIISLSAHKSLLRRRWLPTSVAVVAHWTPSGTPCTIDIFAPNHAPNQTRSHLSARCVTCELLRASS